MLSKLDVITFRGSGGCVFSVDNFFFAVQVCSPVYRHYKVPAGDMTDVKCSLSGVLLPHTTIISKKERQKRRLLACWTLMMCLWMWMSLYEHNTYKYSHLSQQNKHNEHQHNTKRTMQRKYIAVDQR